MFNKKVIETISGQQLPRTSWDKISNLKLFIPNMTEQEHIIAKIESYEAEITKLEEVMSKSSAQKQAILKRYLS